MNDQKKNQKPVLSSWEELRQRELQSEEDQAYREQVEAFDGDWPANRALDFNLEPETLYWPEDEYVEPGDENG